MKYFILLTLTFLLCGVTVADQRFETEQGNCHIAYDPADDDNEIYSGSCENSIDPYDAGDGQGRLAAGFVTFTKTYQLTDRAFPKPLLKGGNQSILLKGSDAGLAYTDTIWTEAPNIPCVMVTSNYDAATGTNNYTEYVTNDWNMEMMRVGELDYHVIETVDKNLNKVKLRRYEVDIEVHLACRNGVAQ